MVKITRDNYRIEDVEQVKAEWGITYIANFRSRADNFLVVHRVTATSISELLEKALNLYGVR